MMDTTIPQASHGAAMASNGPSLVDMQAGTATMSAPSPPPAPAPGGQPGGEPQMAKGGILGDTFSNVDWVEASIMGVLGAALFYMIYYYRLRIQTYKGEHVELANDVTELKAKMSKMMQATARRKVI